MGIFVFSYRVINDINFLYMILEIVYVYINNYIYRYFICLYN